MKRVHCLCPLFHERNDAIDIQLHKAGPQMPFRMLGLVAWGTDETSQLHDLRFGQDSVGKVDVGPVPLALFDVRNSKLDEPLTFDRARELAEAGKLGGALQPFAKLDGLFRYPGQHIHVQVSGPCTALALYGFLFEHDRAPYMAKVEALPAGGYCGVLSLEEVDGARELCRVEAPDSLAAATMLAGAMRPVRGF
jgi:hypothetical protein